MSDLTCPNCGCLVFPAHSTPGFLRCSSPLCSRMFPLLAAPAPSPRPEAATARGEDGEAVRAQAGMRAPASPGSGDAPSDLVNRAMGAVSRRDYAEASRAVTELRERAESAERDLAAARAEVERLRGALNEISEALPCTVDHTSQPEVRCGECGSYRSGHYWCAGCVARAALAASTPAPASGIRGVLVTEGPLPSEWPEGTAMRVTVEEPASPDPSVGEPGDGGEEVDRG